jgi:predicted PhzF superfamily epimerase YddE/YHI9
LISQIPCRGVIVTAKGDKVDFVSRFFGPRVGVTEDPVTGSAHTTLTPIWAEKLNKNKLNAVQLSERRGELICELEGDRVKISGKAITYMVGKIFLSF